MTQRFYILWQLQIYRVTHAGIKAAAKTADSDWDATNDELWKTGVRRTRGEAMHRSIRSSYRYSVVSYYRQSDMPKGIVTDGQQCWSEDPNAHLLDLCDEGDQGVEDLKNAIMEWKALI